VIDSARERIVIARRSTLLFALAPVLAATTARARAQTPPAPAPSVVALRGGTVHTAAGQVIANGVVIIRDGKIVDVGSGLAIRTANDGSARHG